MFCVDKSVTAVVIKGLADHKDELGAPLCPCRHYDDKQAEANEGFWNCPCVPMRERKVCVGGTRAVHVLYTCCHHQGYQHLIPQQECHCMLFLTPDNDFAGADQSITMDELKSGIEGM